MAKTQINTFLPARLVKGHRWYIVFYQVDPVTNKRVRFRETFDLNRIPNLITRQKRANFIILQINSKLPFGYPYEGSFKRDPAYTNILEAIAIAEKIKCRSDRPKTVEAYSSMARIFNDFLVGKEWADMKIGAFQKRHALEFLDYATFTRGIGNRTYNNYLSQMRAFFKELQERDYVAENPFDDFKKKKLPGKTRRAFSQEEKEVVIRTIAGQDKWLLLAVLLQYYCFIRPIELLRLRFHMIDLKEGLIRLPAAITKNKQNSLVTIPDVFVPILERFQLHRWDPRWLIFGQRIQPHPDKAAGKNSIRLRHKRILEALRDEGELLDLTGLSLYSWKDTGALELFKQKVNPLEIMKQLRHTDLATTQLYCQSLYSVNREIKLLDNNLLGDDLLRGLSIDNN